MCIRLLSTHEVSGVDGKTRTVHGLQAEGANLLLMETVADHEQLVRWGKTLQCSHCAHHIM